jgi:hypothetical protein
MNRRARRAAKARGRQVFRATSMGRRMARDCGEISPMAKLLFMLIEQTDGIERENLIALADEIVATFGSAENAIDALETGRAVVGREHK